MNFDIVNHWPRYITVNGCKWVIKIDGSRKDIYGETDITNRTISIGVLGVEAMSKGRIEIARTFIHEILHAVRLDSGIALEDDAAEEKTVRMLECMIFTFLTSNKKQIKSILEMIDNLK